MGTPSESPEQYERSPEVEAKFLAVCEKRNPRTASPEDFITALAELIRVSADHGYSTGKAEGEREGWTTGYQAAEADLAAAVEAQKPAARRRLLLELGMAVATGVIIGLALAGRVGP